MQSSAKTDLLRTSQGSEEAFQGFPEAPQSSHRRWRQRSVAMPPLLLLLLLLPLPLPPPPLPLLPLLLLLLPIRHSQRRAGADMSSVF